MAPEESAEAVRKRLGLLRVAKDLFLSEWYQGAADALLSRDGRHLLREIAAESLAEREAALSLIEEWAERPEAHDAHHQAIRAMRVTMARDFLDGLIHLKQASADVLEKAAVLAPPDLVGRLHDLAVMDLRHAMLLRRLVLDEVTDVRDLLPTAPIEAPPWDEERLPPEYRR